MANEEQNTPKPKKKAEFYSGTGRRKSSVARVWLYDKKGEITVNDVDIREFYTGKYTLEWVQPFHSVGISHPQSKFSASIKVHGGGKTGQIDAIKLGIARALVAYDPSFKEILRTNDLFTRDSRVKERKKPFLKKARKKPQYSKR